MIFPAYTIQICEMIVGLLIALFLSANLDLSSFGILAHYLIVIELMFVAFGGALYLRCHQLISEDQNINLRFVFCYSVWVGILSLVFSILYFRLNDIEEHFVYLILMILGRLFLTMLSPLKAFLLIHMCLRRFALAMLLAKLVVAGLVIAAVEHSFLSDIDILFLMDIASQISFNLVLVFCFVFYHTRDLVFKWRNLCVFSGFSFFSQLSDVSSYIFNGLIENLLVKFPIYFGAFRLSINELGLLDRMLLFGRMPHFALSPLTGRIYLPFYRKSNGDPSVQIGDIRIGLDSIIVGASLCFSIGLFGFVWIFNELFFENILSLGDIFVLSFFGLSFSLYGFFKVAVIARGGVVVFNWLSIISLVLFSSLLLLVEADVKIIMLVNGCVFALVSLFAILRWFR